MIDISILKTLEPISNLSPSRMQELAALCFIEKVSKGIDPFRMNLLKNAQAMYLMKGQLALHFDTGATKIVIAKTEQAKHAISLTTPGLKNVVALSDIEILRIDMDLLDLMMTWDQLTTSNIRRDHEALIFNTENQYDLNYWMRENSAFSLCKLQTGIFSRLPSANIEEMFRRMKLINVSAGQVIINQGAEGDYYYLIESGEAEISRISTAGQMEVQATITSGASFGEEALAAGIKRNATVTMITEGTLLRLGKQDFVKLLSQPLIYYISSSEVSTMVGSDLVFLDVRTPSEYKFNHLPDAINFPLFQLRSSLNRLDKAIDYIVYCQTGRRSSAAAFILIEHGFKVKVLNSMDGYGEFPDNKK